MAPVRVGDAVSTLTLSYSSAGGGGRTCKHDVRLRVENAPVVSSVRIMQATLPHFAWQKLPSRTNEGAAGVEALSAGDCLSSGKDKEGPLVEAVEAAEGGREACACAVLDISNESHEPFALCESHFLHPPSPFSSSHFPILSLSLLHTTPPPSPRPAHPPLPPPLNPIRLHPPCTYIPLTHTRPRLAWPADSDITDDVATGMRAEWNSAGAIECISGSLRRPEMRCGGGCIEGRSVARVIIPFRRFRLRESDAVEPVSEEHMPR